MTPYKEMVGKVIYHLLTDRFRAERLDVNPLAFQGGTYDHIIDAVNCGFFAELGADILQVSPPYEQVAPVWDPEAQRFDYAAHGYWPDNHVKLSERYGDLARFLKVARENDLETVFDVVRHTGPGSSLYRQHPSWFTPPESWFWNLPELNLESEIPRNYLFQSLRNLRDIDPESRVYYRWDTLHHLPDSYIAELFSSEQSSARDIWSVGEVLDGNPEVLRKYLNLGAHAVYNYPVWFVVAEELCHEAGDVGKVADVFRTMFGGFQPSQLVNFAQNHDMDLLRSYSLAKGASPDASMERLKMAQNLVFFLPGIPSIYYLDSTGWTGQNFSDPNRSGRYCLEWPAEQGPLYAHLAQLSRVRKGSAALTYGSYREVWRPGANPAPIIAFERKVLGETVIVLINNGDDEHGIRIPVSLPDKNVVELMGVPVDAVVRNGVLLGTVPARSVLVVS